MLAVATLAACAMPAPPRAPAGPAAVAPAAPEPTTPPATEEDRDRKPRLFRGSGPVLGTARPVARIETAAGGQMTLNFVGAEIREVVRAILGDILKVNYVIDPQVQGTVTMHTSRPIDRDALLSTLEDVLRVNNAVLVRGEGQSVRILPAAEASRIGVPVQGGLADQARDQGFGVRIVPLQFIGAGEMEKVLEPLAPKGAILRSDKTRNLIVLAGTASELASLSDAIELFDVDWLRGMSFGMFPLEFSDAKTMAAELAKVFGAEDGEQPVAGLRLIPLERLNALMVITQRPQYLDEVRKWIERLDESGDGGDRQVYVYFAQNAKAADLAVVLSELFGARGAQRPPEELLAPSLRPTELRTQPRPITGLGQAAPATGVAAAPPAAAAGVAGTAAGPGAAGLRSAQQPLLPSGARQGAAASPVPTSTVTETGMRIIAHDTRNALVIYATRPEYKKVEATLRKLDILPLQVLIQATIAEVTLTDELRYGVQWFFDSGRRGTFTLSEAASGAVSSAFPGFSYVFNRPSIRVVLNALSEITDVNVVSAPHLLVLDNQSAAMQVGDQVPVATQSAVSTIDPAAPIVNSINFRDTGVILRVTPRINSGGLITLEIEQEVSDVVRTTTSTLNSPTIQQRRFSSSVAVQSGESVVLGGLIRDRTDRGKSGVPLLSDIPIFGALFGARSNTDSRTELMVVLTPQIVRNQFEARSATEEMRRRLQQVAPYTRNDGHVPTQPKTP